METRVAVVVHAVNRPDVAPLTVSDRFRHEITYFMSLPGEPGVPASLPRGHYWVSLERAREWLDDGVFHLVSPLDSENQTEVELSEEHETWLEWLVAHDVEQIRLE
jgi:hypothetical protein